MASFELPDMNSADLERFLSDHSKTLQLSHVDRLALRIRRRRRSLARRVATEDVRMPAMSSLPLAAIASAQRYVYRLLIVGDDVPSKLDLVAFLTGRAGPSSTATAVAGDGRTASLAKVLSPRSMDVRLCRMISSGNHQNETPLVEVYAPSSAASDHALRLELWQHCDAVVIVFSVSSSKSFQAVQTRWKEEATMAGDMFQKEQEHQQDALLQDHHRDDGSKKPPPPIVLVAVDSEIRQGHSSSSSLTQNGSSHPLVVSSKDGVRLAQELGASKYVEVHTGNASHARAVWQQAFAAIQQVHQAAALLDEMRRSEVGGSGYMPSSLRRGLPLYEHLKPPPPCVDVDPARYLIVVRPGDGNENGEPTADVEGDAFVYVADGSGGEATTPSSSSSLLLSRSLTSFPASGRLPVPLDAVPKQIHVATLRRCMFSSDETHVVLPQAAEAPVGYVDIATKSFVILPTTTAAVVASGRGGGGDEMSNPHQYSGASRRGIHNDESVLWRSCRYTLDGSEPNDRSPLYLGPVPLADHVDLTSTTWMTPEDSAAASLFSPWPQHARPPPHVVKVAQMPNGCFPSRTIEIPVPTLLETPRCVFQASDNTLRIDAMNPVATYRYTLDGSTPSYTNGFEYLRPVLIPNSTSSNNGNHPRIRVVALPRLFFPSREVVLDVHAPPPPPSNNSSNAPVHRSSSSNADSSGAAFTAHRRSQQAAVQSARPVSTGGRSPARRNSPQGGVHRATTATPVVVGEPQQIFVTRSASLRAEHTHQKRVINEILESTPAMVVAPGSRSASPLVRSSRGGATGSGTPDRSLMQRDKEGGTPLGSPHRQREAQPYQQESGACTQRERHTSLSVSGKIPIQPPPPNSSSGAGCLTEENTVEFSFPSPISLSHITVVTPGDGKGPSTYEVFVTLQDTSTWMGVGSGDLEDRECVQTMTIVPSARQMPVVKVRCVFGGPVERGAVDDDETDVRGAGLRRRRGTATTSTFVVRDMKVHGKPFSAVERGGFPQK